VEGEKEQEVGGRKKGSGGKQEKEDRGGEKRKEEGGWDVSGMRLGDVLVQQSGMFAW
jgi:hypothetical protein